MLEAARREGTGWVKVDRELVAKVDAALKDAGAALQKAERENSSLYFQVCPITDALLHLCIVSHSCFAAMPLTILNPDVALEGIGASLVQGTHLQRSHACAQVVTDQVLLGSICHANRDSQRSGFSIR